MGVELTCLWLVLMLPLCVIVYPFLVPFACHSSLCINVWNTDGNSRHREEAQDLRTRVRDVLTLGD